MKSIINNFKMLSFITHTDTQTHTHSNPGFLSLWRSVSFLMITDQYVSRVMDGQQHKTFWTRRVGAGGGGGTETVIRSWFKPRCCQYRSHICWIRPDLGLWLGTRTRSAVRPLETTEYCPKLWSHWDLSRGRRAWTSVGSTDCRFFCFFFTKSFLESKPDKPLDFNRTKTQLIQKQRLVVLINDMTNDHNGYNCPLPYMLDPSALEWWSARESQGLSEGH